MNFYHVTVTQEDDWFIGRVLERSGITTQGQTLDELVYMVQDAIRDMSGEQEVQLELILPADVRLPPTSRTVA